MSTHLEQDQSPLFEKLSRLSTFAALLGRIHDAIAGIKTPGGRANLLLPIQVLADHLEDLGHHEAADAVRTVICDGVQVWQAMDVKYGERSLFEKTSTATVKFSITGLTDEEHRDNANREDY